MSVDGRRSRAQPEPVAEPPRESCFVTPLLHGAMGSCDETTLSWLSRHSLPLRRLPHGLSATRALLVERLGRHGLTGVFGGGP